MLTSVAGPTTARTRPLMPLIHWCGESPRIVDVDRDVGLAAAHLARRRRRRRAARRDRARGRRARSAIAGALPARRVDRERPGDRAAVACRLHRGRVELAVAQREPGADPVERAAVGEHAADRSSPRRRVARRATRRTTPGRRRTRAATVRRRRPPASPRARSRAPRGRARRRRAPATRGSTVHVGFVPSSRMSTFPLTLLEPTTTSRSCSSTTPVVALHLDGDRGLPARDLALERHRIRQPALGERGERPERCRSSATAMPSIVPRNSALTGDCAIARLQRELVDRHLRFGAGRAVAIRERAAGDREVADAERARRRLGRRRARPRSGRVAQLPVAAARRRSVSSAMTGSTRLRRTSSKCRSQQRQQRDLRLELLRRQQVRRLRPRRVAEAHVVGDDPRPQPELEVDAAADGDLASGRRLDARLDGTDELVGVDGRRRAIATPSEHQQQRRRRRFAEGRRRQTAHRGDSYALRAGARRAALPAGRYASAALNAASAALPGTSSASPSALSGTSTVFCASCRSVGSSSTYSSPVTTSPCARCASR